MDILALTEFKTKKDLKKYLKENSIECDWLSDGGIFKATYSDIVFNVSVAIIKGKVYSYTLKIDKDIYSYEQMIDMILQLKQEFTKSLGQPMLDNTNHLDYGEIYVKFEDDSYVVIIQSSDGKKAAMDFSAIIDVVCKVKTENSNKKHRLNFNALLYILSMVGGIAWGAIMLASFGDYSPKAFGIWFGAGIAWGILFILGFIIWAKIEKKIAAKNENKAKEVIKRYSLTNDDGCFDGQCTCVDTELPTVKRYTKAPTTQALLKIDGDDVIMYTLKNKEPFCLTKSLHDVYYQILTKQIPDFREGKYEYLFFFYDNEQIQMLESIVFERLIDKEQCNKLFEMIKDVTVEYNPYSIYNSHEIDVLDDEIEVVSKLILLGFDMDREFLYNAIYNVFDSVYYADCLTDLYMQTYEKFKSALSN